MEFPLHVLSEYALLADGERGVLVGPRGDFAWMCAPRWDSDAVFSTLIGGAGDVRRHPGRAVLRVGRLLRDGHPDLAQPVGHHGPGDRVPRGAEHARRPAHRRGRCAASWPSTARPRSGCCWTREAGFGQHQLGRSPGGTACGPPAAVRCTCAGPAIPATAQRRGRELLALITVPAGGHHDLVLEISDRPLNGPARRSRRGVAGHRDGLGAGGPRADRHHRGPRRPARLRRAARPDQLRRRHGGRGDHEPARAGRGRTQLRLPVRLDPRPVLRRPGGRRGRCLPAARFRAVGFVAERILADGPQLKPAYTVTGGPVPDERQLHLPGYPGGSAKVGNWVNKQFQLDAFGEALLLLAAAARHDRLDREHWRGRGGGRRGDREAARRSRRRDLGTGRAALGAFPADLRGRPARRRRGRPGPVRARPGADSPTRCSPTSPPTACTRPAAGSARPTTTGSTPRCCSPPCAERCRPAIPGRWPPWTRCTPSWASDGYVYRYRPDERPLGAAEGAFLLCGFAMALAVHSRAGRPRPSAGSSATGPRAGRPACSPRSTTSPSGRYAATCRRPSSTPCCSSRRRQRRGPAGLAPRTPSSQRRSQMNNEHAGQVVVVTGASGGIGRATALAFGARGAKVALLARGEAGLAGAVARRRAGGRHGAGDPGRRRRPRSGRGGRRPGRGRARARSTCGSTSPSPRSSRQFTDITPAEYKRVTEVSYLGYVYGTMAALQRMRPRDAGTIVQVGSALAYRGIPLQTAYCGAKHAIQGFHESLRCELLHDKSNVHVTMVQMPAVNTPQFDWVLSRLPKPAQPVPPIYQPEVAARGVALRRRPSAAAGSTGSAAPPRAPWSPTRSPPACSTATWAGPGSPPSRTTGPSRPRARPTCGSRPTVPTVTTTARTAASTTSPSRAAPSCGPRSTTACSAAPPSGWPGRPPAAALGRRGRR